MIVRSFVKSTPNFNGTLNQMKKKSSFNLSNVDLIYDPINFSQGPGWIFTKILANCFPSLFWVGVPYLKSDLDFLVQLLVGKAPHLNNGHKIFVRSLC
jgi:hypothetical protein